MFRATNDLEQRCAEKKKIEQKENKDKIKKRKEKTEEKGEKLRIQQWRHTLLKRKETVNNLHR